MTPCLYGDGRGCIAFDLRGLAELAEGCVDERCVGEQLRMYVGGRSEVAVRFGGLVFSIDVACGACAYEVKLDAQPYEGVGQALAYRLLGYVPVLLHFLRGRAGDYVDYVNFFRLLDLPFCVAVIDIIGRRVDAICPGGPAWFR